MHKNLTRDDLVAASGSAPDGLFRKYGVAKDVAPIEGSNRTLRFTISDESVDRDNDTIAAVGWQLDTYRSNPVVLWAHDYSQLPVGKAVALGVEGGALKATAEFADHAFADTVFRMLKGGFLNATSVGFKPKTYKINETRGGLDFETQELLEFSIVPVPANPMALIEARGVGIDVDQLKIWADGIHKALGDEVPKVTLTIDGKTVATEVTEALKLADLVGTDVAAEAVPAAEAEPVAAAAVEPPVTAAADAPELKRGRVLSAANEGRVRQAKELLDGVLAQLAQDADPAAGDVASDEKGTCPTCGHEMSNGNCPYCGQNAADGGSEKAGCPTCGANMVDGACPSCKSDDKAPRPHYCGACGTKLADGACPECGKSKAFVITLDEPPELVLELLEDADVELDVTPDDLRQMLRDAVSTAMGTQVRDLVLSAVNRARGRVD